MQMRPISYRGSRHALSPIVRAIGMLALLLLLAVSGATRARIAQAQPAGGTIRVLPVAVSVAPEGTTSVTVEVVAPPAGLGAWTVDITFAESVVRATTCTTNAATSGFCNPTFRPNKVRIVGVSQTPLTGTVTIATIVLRAVGASGTSTSLTPSYTTFRDFSLDPFTPTLVPATLSVTGGTTIGVRVEPATPTVLVGSEISATVVAQAPAAGLGAWTVDVSYDRTVLTPLLTPQSCTSSMQVGSLCNITYCAPGVSGCTTETSNTVRISGASASGLTGAVARQVIWASATGLGGTGSALTPLIRTFTDPLSQTVASVPQSGRVDLVNPLPVTTAITPTSVVAGGAELTLTVDGSAFVANSVMRFNGADRQTTFISGTRLQARIPSSDTAAPGSGAITVFSPLPGGGLSNAQTLTLISGACTSVTLTREAPSPQTPGAEVRYIAQAGGCAAPLFRFQRYFATSGWQTVQEYSPNPVYTWNTTGFALGGYHVIVDAKRSGSVADNESRSALNTLELKSACVSVTLTPNLPSPQSTDTTIRFTALASGCTTPGYRFRIASPGGVPVTVQDYSSADVYTWNTSALAPGIYTIAVSAKRNGSIRDLEAETSTAYELKARCSAVTLASNYASPQSVGTSIRFTAQASGCTGPQYRFLQYSSANGWQMKRDWNTINTFDWITTGLPAESYYVAVEARRGGASGGAEVNRSTTYELKAPCTSVMLTSTLASPQSVGTIIPFTAQASGCTAPQYRFWLYSNTLGWIIAQNYSASNVFNWDTSGYAAVGYYVAVWARQGNSVRDQEAQFTISYALRAAASLTTSGLGSPAAVPTPLPPVPPPFPAQSLASTVPPGDVIGDVETVTFELE